LRFALHPQSPTPHRVIGPGSPVFRSFQLVRVVEALHGH
jgi:hypothetical protein